MVSIHVPLAEHDRFAEHMARWMIVSIHVPLAEHDNIAAGTGKSLTGFNSRAPRGARRSGVRHLVIDEAVSIHVPLAEHDEADTGR